MHVMRGKSEWDHDNALLKYVHGASKVVLALGSWSLVVKYRMCSAVRMQSSSSAVTCDPVSPVRRSS